MFKQKYCVTLDYQVKLKDIEATSEADALKKARKMIGVTAKQMRKFKDNSRAVCYGCGLIWADR